MDAVSKTLLLSDAWGLGLVVTPVYFTDTATLGGKNYQARAWYIKADYKGNIVIYEKPVAFGNSISSEKNPDVCENIILTYQHILNKIKNK